MSDGGSGRPDPRQPQALQKPFAGRIAARSEKLATKVCLGIDPRPALHPLTHPDRFDGDPAKTGRAVVHYFQGIVEATHDLVACYKLQSAFFETLGVPGLIALAQLLAEIRSRDVPVILDGKRGDVGSTAQAYAEAYLGEGVFAADALTVNPYLGLDTLQPFLDVATANGRGVIVVVKSSNSGSGSLQDLNLASGEPLWQHLAAELARLTDETADGDGCSPVGAVVGATHPAELAEARRILPRTFLLIPGYGAQGGRAGDISPALAGGAPAVVSSSRALTYPNEGEEFVESARNATLRMRDELNAVTGT